MKKTALLFFISAMIFSQENYDFSGNLNYYYVNRLTDGTIINLPFRIADFTLQKDNGEFSIYSNMAMEYRIPSDNHFLDDTSSQDFIWDLRELYLSWYLSFGEIRIGKQIHAWGSTDGNSPIDNLNAKDYYYFFESGADQKLGSFSTAADFYLGSWKLGFTFSPIHQTSRLPLNDPEFPVSLPLNPKSSQVIEVENPLEAGGYIRKSFNRGEITLSYFNGYDRIFSPSGFNVWDNETFNMPKVVIDTIFSYRKTQFVGMGMVLFLGELNLRGDFAYFKTKDPSINFIELDYLGTALSDIDKMFYTNLRENDSKEFNVNAEYYQTNFQFEYETPWNLKIIGQYIKYDTLKYFDNLGIVNINLPGLEVNFDPADYFSPGMGFSIASLTKNVLLLDLTKTFYDNRLTLNIGTMMDQVHSGYLTKFGFMYDITESLKGTVALTKIIGDKSQGDYYTFNNMEDFSNIRYELQYSF